jgi:hypothetical protein
VLVATQADNLPIGRCAAMQARLPRAEGADPGILRVPALPPPVE